MRDSFPATTQGIVDYIIAVVTSQLPFSFLFFDILEPSCVYFDFSSAYPSKKSHICFFFLHMIHLLIFFPTPAGNLYGKTGLLCNHTSRMIYIFTFKQAYWAVFPHLKNKHNHCSSPYSMWSLFGVSLDFLSYQFWFERKHYIHSWRREMFQVFQKKKP